MPGPSAGLPAEAKAYGRYCSGQSRKRSDAADGTKGTPFSQCVTGMAKLATGVTDSPPKALSKEHTEGGKGTPFSACVTQGAKLLRDQEGEGRGLTVRPAGGSWVPTSTAIREPARGARARPRPESASPLVQAPRGQTGSTWSLLPASRSSTAGLRCCWSSCDLALHDEHQLRRTVSSHDCSARDKQESVPRTATGKAPSPGRSCCVTSRTAG
jgi:hypothetical protein